MSLTSLRMCDKLFQMRWLKTRWIGSSIKCSQFAVTTYFGVCPAVSPAMWSNAPLGDDELTVPTHLDPSVQKIRLQIRWHDYKVDHRPLIYGGLVPITLMSHLMIEHSVCYGRSMARLSITSTTWVQITQDVPPNHAPPGFSNSRRVPWSTCSPAPWRSFHQSLLNRCVTSSLRPLSHRWP